jgi:hypothetical protein
MWSFEKDVRLREKFAEAAAKTAGRAEMAPMATTGRMETQDKSRSRSCSDLLERVRAFHDLRPRSMATCSIPLDGHPDVVFWT